MNRSFDLLSPQTLENLPRDKTVFIFSIGGFEDHGPHLPLGLDLLEARAIADKTAERIERDMTGWTAVLMPSFPAGVDSITSRIAFTVRGYILRDFLVDYCKALAGLGFEHFLCLTGSLGPKQLTAIEEAGKTVRRRFGRRFIQRRISGGRGPQLISASSGLISFEIALASPAWPDPTEHGGSRDTSIALAIAPDSVGSIYKTLPPRNREERFLAQSLGPIAEKTASYWGNPGDASSAKGHEELSRTLDSLFPKIRVACEGADGSKVFRSWYSAFPMNGSYFKAWLLALSLCLLIALWIRLSYDL